MIVILTQEFDPHADIIADELNRRRVCFTRVHTADLPLAADLNISLDGASFKSCYKTVHHKFDWQDVKSIWYRRPAPFAVNDNMTSDERRFASVETRLAVGGLLRTLKCFWISHPERISAAEHKILQLATAQQFGLQIPRTLVTNVPQHALDFLVTTPGQVIYKTLGGGIVVDANGAGAIYTSMVTERDLSECADRVRQAPCLFQQYVEKQVELRINVFGTEVFTAAVDSQAREETRIDWRISPQVGWQPFDLPSDVSAICIRLIHHFGLAFGAIDMILTPASQFVFLELNPNGQWAWLEPSLGLDMREALIRMLVRGSI